MPKNIILCSDGTGNSIGKGRGTNVARIHEALDLYGHRDDPTLCPQLPLGRSIGGEPPTPPLPGLLSAGRRATTTAIAPPPVYL